MLYETDMSLLGDATGNAAVKEGDVVVWKDKDFMVLTNFMLSRTDDPLAACNRYRIATNMLNEREHGLDLARAILSNVHNEWRWATKHSVIRDLANAIMYIYYFEDAKQMLKQIEG